MARTSPSGPMPRADRPQNAGPSASSRRDLLRNALAVGLGATTLPAFLAACGGAADKPTPPASNDAGRPAATAAPATTGVNYPTGYKGPRASRKAPFGDGKTTFKIVVPEDAVTVGDWNKNDFSAWFEQRTGVKVEYQTVPTTNNDMTKINAMIGAKDLPDAFLNIPFTRDQISAYGVQGVFVAIDDHVDKYAIELKAAMADAPDLKQLSKGTDGRMYVFPSVNDCRQCKVSPGRAWVNQKFIEAADTKIPETADDFRAMLKAFKNMMPAGMATRSPSPRAQPAPSTAG